MRTCKLQVHPFFIGLGIYFYCLGQGRLFLQICTLWLLQEGAKACCAKSLWEGKQWVRRLSFTPVGIRATIFFPEDASLKQQVCMFLSGSLMGLFLSILIFAWGSRELAGIALLLSSLRLLPFLPFDGGELLLVLLGKKYGTIRTAALLTRIGMGIGWGCVAFGMVFAVLYLLQMTPIFMGLYLIQANRLELRHILKRFLVQMQSKKTQRPIQPVFVCGKESPLELLERTSPYTQAVFLREDTLGVSESRVFQAFFGGKSVSWLWRIADSRVADDRRAEGQ